MFAEAFKARMMMMIFCGIEEGREDDEKTIVVVVKVSFSFCRSKALGEFEGNERGGRRRRRRGGEED